METKQEKNNQQNPLYSTKQMVEASQVAYLGFLERSKADLECKNNGNGTFTIKEIILNATDIEEAKKKYHEATGQDPEQAKLQELIKYSDLSADDISRIELFQDEVFDWKIIDVTNLNQQTGFYACAIETGLDDALIAFRGSEGNDFYKDWISADFGLINSSETEQQHVADTYVDMLAGKLSQYQNLGVTGHSLGGNLAAHFTLCAAKPGREDFYKKIKQCDSLDGPGFSEKYITDAEHLLLMNQVIKEDGKINHYKWSTVGGLLYELPFEKVQYLDVDESQHNEPNTDSLAFRLFGRHATTSLIFDEQGNAKPGKQDRMSKVLGKISRILDGTVKFSQKYIIPLIRGTSKVALTKISPQLSLPAAAIQALPQLQSESFLNVSSLGQNNLAIQQFVKSVGDAIKQEVLTIQQEFTKPSPQLAFAEGQSSIAKGIDTIQRWGMTSSDLTNFAHEVTLSKEDPSQEHTIMEQ